MHKHLPSTNAFKQPSECTPKGAISSGVIPVESAQRLSVREGRGQGVQGTHLDKQVMH